MELLDLITGSLRDIGVIEATQAPSAEQGQNALRNLNNIMASLAEDDVDLGYAPTDDITGDIALPLGHVSAIQSLLALKEASDRGIDAPDLVTATAISGRQRLLKQAIQMQIGRTVAETLPRGNSQISGSFNAIF